MTDANSPDWFGDLDAIIAEPLKFKAKLGIGEDAYTSLRIKKRLGEIWDIVGAAGTGATVANSSVVVSTFFPASGFLAMLGIGSAVTPIGWVIGASVVSAGAWYGITRHLQKQTKDRVVVIPTFINTPMDMLALGLFDLMAPLALKVAAIDGEIHTLERTHIRNCFVNEWGYDESFIEKGISFFESRLSEYLIKEIATALAAYQKKNRDCNFETMSKEIDIFLRGVMEVDGKIDEREEMAIEKVNQIFTRKAEFSIKDILPSMGSTTSEKPAKEEKKSEEFKDEIDHRLEKATPAELQRMRMHLQLKPTADADEIAYEYRAVAGNTLMNVARRFAMAEKITYKEILIGALESLRPAGESIQIFLNTIKLNLPWNQDKPGLGDHREKGKIIEGLELVFIDTVKAGVDKDDKPVQVGKVVGATTECILIGCRQAAESNGMAL